MTVRVIDLTREMKDGISHFPPLHTAFRYFFLTREINSGIDGYLLEVTECAFVPFP